MGHFAHIQTSSSTIIFLLLLLTVEITFSYPHTENFFTPDNPDIRYTYSRFPEIEKHCGFLISSAAELPPDDNRGEKMKKELFFVNGDWVQEPGGTAPLMPFDNRELARNTFGNGNGPPLKLVSFWLKDVDPNRRAKNTVSISGVMEIGIVGTSSLLSYKPYDWSPKFDLTRGTSRLIIIFEGIYLESKDNARLGLMCLLGTATIPSNISGQNMDLDSCGGGDTRRPCQPSAVQDDQILLVLRFPKTFSLTTRSIGGEMKSLNYRWSPTYFDEVHISSQLSENSKYQFGSEDILSNTCSPYPYPDCLINKAIEIFRGDDYCEKLRQYLWNEVFEFGSTWKNTVKKSNDRCKIGPFSLDEETEATYESSDKLKLMFQELYCEPGTDQNGAKTAMVSAVLRVIQKSEYLRREEMRTGLSSLTLSAEGRWHSSDGQLCMVGCSGPTATLPQRCHSRITLYFPLTISIKQTSIVLGAIISINASELHDPLIFQRVTTPADFLQNYYWNRDLKWSYQHSKMRQAREFQRRSQPSNLGRILRKAFFRYPSSKGEDIASFSFFADVLSVEVWAAPQTLTDSDAPKTNVELVLLSMGSLLGRYQSPSHIPEEQESQEAFHSISEEIEISGHLKIKGGQFYNLSLLFEGIYDPTVGQMHLIGCRDVQDFEEFSNGDRNLEGRLDCLIEIKVEYSPKNARWLLNPNIRFSINCQRSKEDPFYFPPLSTNTFLLSYEKKFHDVLIRKGFEEGLRILLLVVAILCICSQSRYTENQGHPTAYISMVMLGLQALGFSITLITGDEALLKWKEFTPYRNSKYDFRKFQFLQPLDICIKFLLLLAILESIKLLQRVWESRKKLRVHVKQLNFRIPSDKLVLTFFVLIHVVGFCTLYSVRRFFGIPLLVQSKNYYTFVKGMQKWWPKLEDCGGLLQDCFLLPQIIGNALWGVQGEQPLRKIYYIGFTMIRLVLQVYDYARDPLPNPNYSAIEFQYLVVESYYKLGNIMVSVIIVTLALTVYVQQKVGYWNIRKMEESDNLESKPGYIYERLLSE